MFMQCLFELLDGLEGLTIDGLEFVIGILLSNINLRLLSKMSLESLYCCVEFILLVFSQGIIGRLEEFVGEFER